VLLPLLALTARAGRPMQVRLTTMLGPSSKSASKDERDAWKRLQIDASTAGAITSGLAGLGAVAAGVTAAVTVPPLFVAGAVAWWAQRKLVTVERKIEDPPRLDYDDIAVAAPQPVYADAFGSDPLEEIAHQFLRDVAEATALEDAMVLADERHDGAQLMRRRDAAEARAAEMRGLAAALWVRTEALNTIGQEMSKRLQAHQLRAPTTNWARVEARGRLIDGLPPEVQARLFRAGMDVHPFAQEVIPFSPTADAPDPLAKFAVSLRDAVDRSLDFARTVRQESAEPTADWAGR
jgi:hypothetical protein